MARSTKNLSALADDVLRMVERERVVKTASVSYTSDMKTEIGASMEKLAQLLRADPTSTEITYGDLQEFRRRYAV